MTEWITRNDDKTNNPTEPGLYAVMVTGDSEYVDGHCVYSFPEYQNFAEFKLHEEGGVFKGAHDEEDEFIFAYYGPIIIPPYEASK